MTKLRRELWWVLFRLAETIGDVADRRYVRAVHAGLRRRSWTVTSSNHRHTTTDWRR